MSHEQKFIRHGACAVRPYLYGNLDLPDFVREVFGAVELERIPVRDGFHIEARIGDSMLIMEAGSFPSSAQVTINSTYVYVADVDAAYRRALEMGAMSITAPENKRYQERGCGVRDSFGNTWWIATYTG